MESVTDAVEVSDDGNVEKPTVKRPDFNAASLWIIYGINGRLHNRMPFSRADLESGIIYRILDFGSLKTCTLQINSNGFVVSVEKGFPEIPELPLGNYHGIIEHYRKVLSLF